LSPEGGFALLRELAANACRDRQEIDAPSAAKLFRDAPANSPRRSCITAHDPKGQRFFLPPANQISGRSTDRTHSRIAMA
jgi:hypothetical protein